MKAGLVTVLLEKPDVDTKDYKNFRLMGNLSTISKIIERRHWHIKRDKPTSPSDCQCQSAYRSGHSTESALLTIMDDIYCHADAGKTSALIGLYLQHLML